MARPRKYIDKDEFEKLCGLQCTKQEICGWFDVTNKTLDAWVKRTYRSSFSEVFGQKRSTGRVSLRRSQFRMARSNPGMAIWKAGMDEAMKRLRPKNVLCYGARIDYDFGTVPVKYFEARDGWQ